MKEAYITEILRSIKVGQIYTLARVEEFIEMLRENDDSFLLYETVINPKKFYEKNNCIIQIGNEEFIVIFITRFVHASKGVHVKCIYNYVFDQF